MKNTAFAHQEFKNLLAKFETGNCSREELSRLHELVSDSKSAAQLKNAMFDEIKDFETDHTTSNERYSKVFDQIQQKISQQQQSRQRIINLRFNIIRIAAMVVLAFILGGTISYFAFKPHQVQIAKSFCEVSAPMGSTSQILLPDNSSVWLNAGSKIKYSTTFNKTERFLQLEGEGYFKVAKNEDIPFIVNAYGFEVKAIGTEFNVKAYKEETTIETTMVEGKVSLHHATENIMEGVYLIPNQKATFFKKEKDITVEVLKKIEEKHELNYIPEHRLVIAPRIDPRALISWKENRLIIEREQLSTLTEILSRKYNFSFEFKSDDIKHFSFSGTLEDETLQQVMDVIKFSSPIDYTIVGKTVFIERNDNRAKEFKKLFKN
ncbi:MAG: FecR family protein [Prolixibacteraceae bacterium]|nr:FecR family protein [Prolixibacteraceae bacterium]